MWPVGLLTLDSVWVGYGTMFGGAYNEMTLLGTNPFCPSPMFRHWYGHGDFDPVAWLRVLPGGH